MDVIKGKPVDNIHHQPLLGLVVIYKKQMKGQLMELISTLFSFKFKELFGFNSDLILLKKLFSIMWSEDTLYSVITMLCTVVYTY